jgi:hypothetical protein
MTEKHAHSIHLETVLVADSVGLSCNQVVIAMDVLISRTAKSVVDFAMRCLSRAELRQLPSWRRRGQCLPNVTKKYDLFEIVLEKVEKPQELIVLMSEDVSAATAKMKIGNDSYLHGFYLEQLPLDGRRHRLRAKPTQHGAASQLRSVSIGRTPRS